MRTNQEGVIAGVRAESWAQRRVQSGIDHLTKWPAKVHERTWHSIGAELGAKELDLHTGLGIQTQLPAGTDNAGRSEKHP